MLHFINTQKFSFGYYWSKHRARHKHQGTFMLSQGLNTSNTYMENYMVTFCFDT